VYPIPYDVLRVGITLVVTAVLYGGVMMLPTDDTTQLIARTAALPVYALLLVSTRVLGASTIRTLLRLVKR